MSKLEESGSERVGPRTFSLKLVTYQLMRPELPERDHQSSTTHVTDSNGLRGSGFGVVTCRRFGGALLGPRECPVISL